MFGVVYLVVSLVFSFCFDELWGVAFQVIWCLFDFVVFGFRLACLMVAVLLGCVLFCRMFVGFVGCLFSWLLVVCMWLLVWRWLFVIFACIYEFACWVLAAIGILIVLI